MEYLVKCADARMVGAIGIFHPVALTIEAADRQEAERLFRDRYETRRPVCVFDCTPTAEVEPAQD
jgi:hypothetical protein